MKLKNIVQGLVIAGLASHALAQEATQRVEITGSSIKRIQAEGALPVQILKAEDLQKQGITTAEQLISSLSANGSGINNLATNQGGDFLNSTADRAANNGASGASLRGLGPQYTLVLLNGRRVSTYGLNGKSVDLNSIPLAVIDRVEVLKDGASAIYGTDAIGGVINFILKKDFTGLQISGFVDATQGGGGDMVSTSATFGWGSLDRDGFNLVASLAVDSSSRLRGSQRSFQNGYQPSRGLAPDTTGAPIANIGVGSGTALSGSFVLPGTTTSISRIGALNLQNNCTSITDMSPYRGDITGFNSFNKACAYDYGKQWSLMQPVDRINLVSKVNFKLGNDHVAFVEAVASRVNSSAEYTPIQITTNGSGANYPAGGPYYQNLATLFPTLFKPTNTDPTDLRVFFDATKQERIRWRCLPCGPRQQDTTADSYRLLAGMEGVLAGWDYKFGLSTAQSKPSTVLGDGYVYQPLLTAAVATGVINPFSLTQTAAGQAAVDATKAKGTSLYGGEAHLRELDGTISREIAKLPAGPLAMALGVDIRNEDFRFNEPGFNDLGINGVSAPAAQDKVSRNIKALFTEFSVPIVKNLEAQLALRTDRYSDFGSTTNPKVALRWQALPNLVLRASANKGFHAPDFGALYGGDVTGAFNSDINDPLLCPGGVPTDAAGTGCGIRPDIITKSNPNLKPERSKQWTLGLVFSPADWLTATVDFWQIELTDRVAALSGQELVKNYSKYEQFITRDPDTNVITSVNAPFFNLAGDKARGIDINLTAGFKTAFGKVTASIDGSYLNSFKTRFSPSDPFVERVGEFGDATYGWDLQLRWKHTATVSLNQGPWTTTLTQIYKSGYKDEVDGYGSGVILQNLGFQSHIKSYALYNFSASYEASKNTTLTAGINNLLDTNPPFSLHNVDNVAGAGWDARVGDPRGRSFVVRIDHKFF
jgi:iron complex outermembrane receptor protein